VLDYACGSGTCFTPIFASAWCFDKEYCRLYLYFLYAGQISRALAPYVAQLVGVDISPRMVEVYNARASTQGLEPNEMRAVSSLAELQQQRFDLAVVSH
jgi:SAM-dependent methyltransferase